MTNFDEQQDLKTKQHLVVGETTTSRAALPAGSAPGQQELHQIGSIIADRYKILEMIGEGGVGQVYKAKQLATGRVVAIKMLVQNVLDDRAKLRFHQEAKAASAINHANAIAIYDFGETEADELYLAMEYVEGIDLSKRIEQLRQLPPSEVVDTFLQITDALSDAHQKGIIHRDLKPSNVMLTQTSKRQNVVKILDFGIAKLSREGELSLTKTGEVFGSPLYMSPEQCNAKQLTPATDIYSIGCMLYEALVGVPPHVGTNPLNTMYLHCQEPAKTFAQVRPDLKIPARLESITLKCLNKNPTDRFASIDELHAALEGIRDGKNHPGSLLKPPFSAYNSRLFLRSMPLLLVLVVAICFSYPTVRRLIEQAQKSMAIQTYGAAFANAQKTNDQEAILAIGIEYPKMLVDLKSPDSRRKAAEFLSCLEKAQEKLLASAQARLETLDAEAWNYFFLQDEKKAIDCRLKILHLLKTTHASTKEIVDALSKIGVEYFRDNNFAKARFNFEQVRTEAETANPSDISDVGRQIALNAVFEGNMFMDEQKYALAIKKLYEAINYKWVRSDRQFLSDWYVKLADCYAELGQTDDAKHALVNAISVAKECKQSDKVDSCQHKLELLSAP